MAKVTRNKQTESQIDFGDNKDSVTVGPGSVWVHPDYRVTVEEFEKMDFSKQVETLKAEVKVKKSKKVSSGKVVKIEAQTITYDGYQVVFGTGGDVRVLRNDVKFSAKAKLKQFAIELGSTYDVSYMDSLNTRQMGKHFFTLINSRV